jgi:hypothetical protein
MAPAKAEVASLLLAVGTRGRGAMKGLPVWMLVLLAGLTGALVYYGWHDRHESGYLPFAIGIIFALFTLGAIGGKAQGEEEE